MGVAYRHGSFRISNIVQRTGSVFPSSLIPAIIVGLFSAGIKILLQYEFADGAEAWLEKVFHNNYAFAACAVLITFLITFRTAKAYDRFWNGCNYVKKMQAEMFVTASNLNAFCRTSAQNEGREKFQHTLIRLLSMLHAVALQQLEVGYEGVKISDSPYPRYELVDVRGIDADTLNVIRNEECRVELIMQWVQSLTVDGLQSGVCNIPPPILSRIFQNLSNALTAYYSAYRVTEVPYPFPYVQTTEVLLLIYMATVPIVIQSFTYSPFWSFLCTFLAAFVILSLNLIAAELENPFDNSQNVLNLPMLQREFNKRLLMLTKTSTNKVPYLSEEANLEEKELLRGGPTALSFADIWQEFDVHLGEAATSYSLASYFAEATGKAGNGTSEAAIGIAIGKADGGGEVATTPSTQEQSSTPPQTPPTKPSHSPSEASLGLAQIDLNIGQGEDRSASGGARANSTAAGGHVIGRAAARSSSGTSSNKVRTVVTLEDVDRQRSSSSSRRAAAGLPLRLDKMDSMATQQVDGRRAERGRSSGSRASDSGGEGGAGRRSSSRPSGAAG